MRKSLPQAGLAVECEGKPQIGIERALVELVEQHRADAGKLGIVKDHAGKDALGDDLDTCLRPGFRDHPRAQSNPLSDSLADRVCAMRSAAARAAMRRGSSTRILAGPSQLSSINANGTRVVLPAPGGATRTADGRAAKASRNSSRTASIGSGVANFMAVVSSRVRPEKCEAVFR